MQTHSIPHTTTSRWPAISPSRAAHEILVDEPHNAAIGLIGFPDDLGIKLNNGRAGAAQGPDAFRAALATYGAASPSSIRWPKVYDAGNVVPCPRDPSISDEAQLNETHSRVTQAVLAMLKLHLFPVAIGGGHDLTFPFVRAVSEHTNTKLRGVYFDAHLDVRESIGSGMPFRRLLDGKFASSLHVLGINDHANTREHTDWFTSQGNHICSAENGINDVLKSWDTPGFASFDMDVVDASHAPGVSAMHPCGVGSQQAGAWCHAVGRCNHVVCFDIMELSPPNDVANRTSRLAAHLFLSFLAGYAHRN